MHWGYFRHIIMAAGLGLFLLAGTAQASPTLRLNSHGHEVLILQQKLHSAGYDISELDGVFGKETEQAVLRFQRDRKLRETGIVSNSTWRALKETKDVPKDRRHAIKPTVASSPAPKGKTVPLNQLFLERGKVDGLVSTAKKYIGTPYQFGGTTPAAFDCSGYLQYIFAQHGMGIPRLADEQYALGKHVTSKKQLTAGDLVFFTTYAAGVSHCGLYLGNDKFIHASGHGVRIDSLNDAYWSPRYVGGKHIVK